MRPILGHTKKVLGRFAGHKQAGKQAGVHFGAHFSATLATCFLESQVKLSSLVHGERAGEMERRISSILLGCRPWLWRDRALVCLELRY